MDNRITLRNYIEIAAVFVLVMVVIAIPFYINLSKNNSTSIEGIVTKVGNNYILVTSNDNKDYRLTSKDKYNVGDKLKIKIKHLDRTKRPITGIISKVINMNEKNDVADEDNDISNYNNNVEDGDIVSYLTDINNDLDNYTEDKSASIKNGFVNIVDFIFYDKELKGVTFKELSDDVKLKVLKIAYSIDNKVDNKMPGYKEEISRNGSKIYSDVKTRLLVSYLDLTNKLCSNNEEICNSAKDGLKELKTNFSLSWDTIKSLAGLGTSKVKNWYEIWKTIE